MTTRSTAPSLDHRSRVLDDVEPLTLDQLVDEIGAAATRANGDLAAHAQAALGLPPLVLTVGDASCTVDRGLIERGARPGAVLHVDPGALADLVAGVRSTYGLVFLGGGRPENDSFREVLAWDHVLQAFFDGRPLHEPGALHFVAPDGSELSFDQTFGPDDDDAAIGHFLAEAGFCRLRGWIDPALLPAIESEVQAAARSSQPEEPDRWWATLQDGTTRCVRVMRLLDSAPHMAELAHGEVFARLQRLFDDGHEFRADEPQASEGLIKPLDVASGLSEFPWHRDCSMGGHHFRCAGYAVGLPLTVTGADAGYLRVMPGSHRVSTPAPGLFDGFDPGLPVLPVETEPGDLTIHVSCILHGTKAPKTVERVVTYTTYSLPYLGSRGAAAPRPELRDAMVSAARGPSS
ncbi:MAG TPA: phytanoyl-CoA dioxygenase family protein [Acidimicrobiales bacterium]|nr:phytanoyl-CoA dioxygenase family protein [Acidimicrobiales bacterium]